MTLARIFAGLLACSLPAFAGAATLTYTNATGTHFHSGGNVGPAYSPLVSDREDPIAISPFGLVLGDHTNAYAGPIPTVAGLRLGRAIATATTIGLMADDGFFFNSTVTAEAECTARRAPASGCIPFMRSEAALSFDMTVDEDATLFLDGQWFGGNGTQSPVSVVDFLAVTIQRDNGFGGRLTDYGVDTNIFNRNQASGLFDGSVSLQAGLTYMFRFDHSAAAQSLDVEGVPDSDTGTFTLAASVIEANADTVAFNARYEAASQVTPAPVPLPAAGWLMLAALGIFGALRRKRA